MGGKYCVLTRFFKVSEIENVGKEKKNTKLLKGKYMPSLSIFLLALTLYRIYRVILMNKTKHQLIILARRLHMTKDMWNKFLIYMTFWYFLFLFFHLYLKIGHFVDIPQFLRKLTVSSKSLKKCQIFKYRWKYKGNCHGS